MSYLIDTNVLSELRRKSPDQNVVKWFSKRPAATLFLSVLTLGEIRKGIEGVDRLAGNRFADVFYRPHSERRWCRGRPMGALGRGGGPSLADYRQSVGRNGA